MSKIKYLKEGIKITSKIINDIMFLYDVRTKDTYLVEKEHAKWDLETLFYL